MPRKQYFHQQQIDNLSFLWQLQREREPYNGYRCQYILFGLFFLRGNQNFIVKLVPCQSRLAHQSCFHFLQGNPRVRAPPFITRGGSFALSDENDRIPSPPHQRWVGIYVQSLSCMAVGNVKWRSCLGKQFGSFSKFKPKSPYNLLK